MTDLEQLAWNTARKCHIDTDYNYPIILAALRQAVKMFNRDIDHWHDLYKEEQAKIAVRDELLRDMAAILFYDDVTKDRGDVSNRYEALIKGDK